MSYKEHRRNLQIPYRTLIDYPSTHVFFTNGGFGLRFDPFGRLLTLLIWALPLSICILVPKIGSTHYRRMEIQGAGKEIAVTPPTKIPFGEERGW